MDAQSAYIQVNSFLIRTFPHIFFLTKHLRIVYDEEFDGTARTNGGQIVVGKKWLMLPLKFRIAIFLHEAYHVLMKHPLRAKAIMKSFKVDFRVVNIAADAKTNYAILQSLSAKLSNINDYRNFLSTFGVPEELLKEGSVEEIVKWLLQRASQSSSSSSPTAGEDLDTSDESSESVQQTSTSLTDSKSSSLSQSQQVLNEGSEELVEASSEKFEEELNKAIRNALISGKIAGATLSAVEERILEELVKSKVDWRSIFRSFINSYTNNLFVQSYARSNRRFSDLPGARPIGKPRAWVFTDVSASISPDEFNQFMSEVSNLSVHTSEIRLITWDTAVTGEYSFKGRINASKLRTIRFKGGGGTKFIPVINAYIKEINPNDILIVLTDGRWFDSLHDVVDTFSRIKCKKILVTTDRPLPGFDHSVKIEN